MKNTKTKLSLSLLLLILTIGLASGLQSCASSKKSSQSAIGLRPYSSKRSHVVRENYKIKDNKQSPRKPKKRRRN